MKESYEDKNNQTERPSLNLIQIIVFDALICIPLMVQFYNAGFAWYSIWALSCFGAAVVLLGSFFVAMALQDFAEYIRPRFHKTMQKLRLRPQDEVVRPNPAAIVITELQERQKREFSSITPPLKAVSRNKQAESKSSTHAGPVGENTIKLDWQSGVCT